MHAKIQVHICSGSQGYSISFPCSQLACQILYSPHTAMAPQLSLKQRHEVVIEYSRLKNYMHVAKKFGCSPATVKKWVALDTSGRELVRKRRQVSKTLMSKEANIEASKQLLEGRQGGARYVASELRNKQLVQNKPSAQTVLRAVKAFHEAARDPIVCTMGRPAPLLTARNRAQRVAWCKANLKTDWDRVMFTDRKKFHFRYPGSKVLTCSWKLRSKKNEGGVFQPNHPSTFNVYGGLTSKGTTRLRPVTGTTKKKASFMNAKGQPARNITQNEYKAVLRETLLPGGVGRLETRWVLQQDHDPTHGVATQVLDDFNKVHDTSVSLVKKWPPHSPDLSPIENVWAIVEREVNAVGCHDFDEYVSTVSRIFQKLDRNIIKKAVCIHA